MQGEVGVHAAHDVTEVVAMVMSTLDAGEVVGRGGTGPVVERTHFEMVPDR